LPPWRDLRTHYATSEEAPSDAKVRGTSFVLYSGDVTGAFEYDTGASFAVTETGLYLATTFERVLVPVAGIKACGRTEWRSHSDTNLWVELARVEVALPDNGREIQAWCSSHAIPLIDRDAAEKLRRGA
jgi:hypothetical protein